VEAVGAEEIAGAERACARPFQNRGHPVPVLRQAREFAGTFDGYAPCGQGLAQAGFGIELRQEDRARTLDALKPSRRQRPGGAVKRESFDRAAARGDGVGDAKRRQPRQSRGIQEDRAGEIEAVRVLVDDVDAVAEVCQGERRRHARRAAARDENVAVEAHGLPFR